MYFNKYGIIIKKSLKEKYPNKYFELQEQGILDTLVNKKQTEVTNLKKDLIISAKSCSLLFKQQLVAIQERVYKEIRNIVDELGVADYEYKNKT